MATYTINYVVYTPGHRRHHAGTQTQLQPPASGQSSSGEQFPVFAFPSLPYMGNNLPFAFMSIVGNADNTHLYTTPGIQNVQAGANNIKITIVYAPQGGGDGHGGPAVWVDAFNVDTGDFSDSDFMEVYTNGALDNAKTMTANNDGVVSSATVEDLRAYSRVDGVPFLEWGKVGGPDIANADYQLAQNEGGIVFAFYQSPPPLPIPDLRRYREGWIYVSPGVLVDGGGIVVGPDGLPHPVDPLGPLAARLMSTLVLLSLSTNMEAEAGEQAIQLAAQNLDAIAKSIMEKGLKQ